MLEGPTVALLSGVKPVFGLDVEARKQLRETRATLLAHLAEDRDDLFALVMADVVGEIDPIGDAELAAHRARFRQMRGSDWLVRARERGIHRLLFHLAHGWAQRGIGRDAVPVLERHAIEISEARAAGVPGGLIDKSFVPNELLGHRRAKVQYYRSGHLQRVAIEIDSMNEGSLELDETPGAGRFAITQKIGGYGTYTTELYRDGAIVTTLCTPWHDGEESREPMPWTKWVLASLDALAALASVKPQKKATKMRG